LFFRKFLGGKNTQSLVYQGEQLICSLTITLLNSVQNVCDINHHSSRIKTSNVFALLYRELTDDSNTTLITLYEAWNKPEKTEKWQAKLPQTEAKIE
jgi:hypothetical protein